MTNIINNPPSRVGLVGEWLLDGNALDTSGSGNNGTATNVTYVKTDKGYQSQAGSFNGSSYINLTTAGIPIGASSRSFSFWVLGLTSQANDTIIYSFGSPNTNQSMGVSISGGGFYQFFVYGGANIVSTIAKNTGPHFFTVIQNGTNISFYIDNNLIGSQNYPSINIVFGTHTIGRLLSIGFGFNGLLGIIRHYNRILSQDETQSLYLEGLRKLGPTNIAKYPSLLSGLVGYFRAEDTGGTALYNLVNGITATRVGGTNTADNLGINKAISNPNYTWASLTYTTGYTFENSGSGWSLVTSPTGLSATGINRTTTLRDVFLFSRTLSTDERNLLESLCNSEYPYPTPSYDLASIRDGLVLDLNEQGLDLSGNGNNGTLVNGPSVVRQGRAKGLSYNGTNQALNIASSTLSTLINSRNEFSFNFLVRLNNFTGTPIIIDGRDTDYNGAWIEVSIGGIVKFIRSDGSTADTTCISTNALSTGIIYDITVTYDGTNAKLYQNSIKQTDGVSTRTLISGTNISIGSGLAGGGRLAYLNGNILKAKIWNRVLSQKEIEQLYYSQKGNFIY